MKVSVIGVGLIGGSIALCLKKKYKEEVYIAGFDPNEVNLHLASSLGVIDQEVTDLNTCLEGADVVFLCTPVQKLCSLLKDVLLSPSLKEGAIVTDVGSTKVQVVEESKKYLEQSKGYFIGGHPMAGSHKTGVEASTDRLFENAYYILTPASDIPTTKVECLKELLSTTRAHIVVMDANEHDQIVGAISHIPHLLASSLVEQVYAYNQENNWYLRLAAGGFRDITRVASSNPRMWRDITLSNKQFILQQMNDWMTRMEEVKQLIEEANPDKIEDFFAHAKQVRDGMLVDKVGAIPAYNDLYVDIPDHPGVIGQITTLLGIHLISITKISILENREDIMGVLRLSFRNKEDLEKALEVIQHANFDVYRRE